MYGRRVGHSLSSKKKVLLSQTLPKIILKQEIANKYLIEKVKKEQKKLTLEIGFGSGENIIYMLNREPETYFLGCEPFISGVANFLGFLEKKNFDRVKLFCGDARIILNNISEKIFSRIIILFPDPWPKFKHHKRRIINKNNLELFSKNLIDGGTIYTATDIKGYFDEIIATFQQNKKYKIINENNFTSKPKEIGQTKYGIKARKNFRTPYYIIAQKTSG